jgi:hypothetical protein
VQAVSISVMLVLLFMLLMLLYVIMGRSIKDTCLTFIMLSCFQLWAVTSQAEWQYRRYYLLGIPLGAIIKELLDNGLDRPKDVRDKLRTIRGSPLKAVYFVGFDLYDWIKKYTVIHNAVRSLIQNFMNICPVRAEMMHVNKYKTDRYDWTKKWFLQLCEHA